MKEVRKEGRKKGRKEGMDVWPYSYLRLYAVRRLRFSTALNVCALMCVDCFPLFSPLAKLLLRASSVPLSLSLLSLSVGLDWMYVVSSIPA